MSKIALIYWSGTGNTEVMADAIEESVKAVGAEIEKFQVSDLADLLMIMMELFGCPAMGDRRATGEF